MIQGLKSGLNPVLIYLPFLLSIIAFSEHLDLIAHYFD